MATRRFELKTLEDLSDNYPTIFIDTSTILWHYNMKSGGLRHGEKIYHAKVEGKFINYLKRFIENYGNLCITDGVKKELLRPDDFFNEEPESGIFKLDRKSRKGAKHELSEDRKRRLSGFYRQMIKRNKKRKSLIDVFMGNGSIIDLDSLNARQRASYNYFTKVFSYLKEKYGLSEIDFDFLFKGFIKSNKENPVALISNDQPIIKAWFYLIRERKISPNRLGFFCREEFGKFVDGFYHLQR